MGSVIAIGPAVQVGGWALAGAEVRPAETDAQARQVWADLPTDVRLLLVSADAARAVAGRPRPPHALLAVLPE